MTTPAIANSSVTGSKISDTSVTLSKLDSAVQSSLAAADTAVQPGDNATTLGSGVATDGYVLTADGVGNTAREAVPGGGGGATTLDELTDVSTTEASLGESLTFNGTTWTPSAAATILEGDSRLTDARTPTSHAASHGSGQADEITIAQSQVTNLTTDLSNKAASVHTHPASDISDSTVVGRDILTAADAAAVHTTLSLASTYAAIPSGTPDGTKFYRDDGTWAAPPSGGLKEVRHAWNAPQSYMGTAPAGSLEGDSVWTITRITVADNGTVTIGTATNASWTNRESETYV